MRGIGSVARVAMAVAASGQGCASPSPKECSSASDCGSGESCLYPVGSCSAKGQCLTPGSLGAMCHHVVQYCACDGTSVGGLCGPNYALGPTLGSNGPCGPPAIVPAGAKLSMLASLPQSAPELLTTDGTNVYFTTTDRGDVIQVPVGGGTPLTLASGQAAPAGIAVDSAFVYWANEGANNDGTVAKVPIGGGTVTTLAAHQGAPYQVAVDDTNVYWTVLAGGGGVMKVAKSGAGQPVQLAAASSAWAVLAHAGTVFYTESRSVLSVPASGGSPSTLAANQFFPYALAADASNLYWTTNGGMSTVVSMPLAGGTPTTLATGNALEGIAVDASNVYFTSTVGNAGTVSSVPLAGGTVTTLVTGQSAPEGLALDATSLYWVDTSVGAVMRLTPK